MTIRRKRPVLAVVAVLTAVGIAGGVALAAGGGSPAPGLNEWGRRLAGGVDPDSAEVAGDRTGAEQFVLYGRDTQFQFVDSGPQGPSVGDTILFKQAIYAHGGVNRVGSLYVECVLHFSDIAECEGTMALSGRGKLTFSGTVPPKPQFFLAITGGTGEFIGRDGEVMVEDGPNVDRYTIVLTK